MLPGLRLFTKTWVQQHFPGLLRQAADYA